MRNPSSRTGSAGPRTGARLGRIASLAMVGAIATLFWGTGSTTHAAQSAPEQAGNRDLLRPLYANSMDIQQGKRVAEHFCASCHGAAGISTIVGVPDLAGQRAAYLYDGMRAYLSGARNNDTMKAAIRYLSTDAMSDAAAYYGGLAPAQPAPADKAGEVDAVRAGKAAAAACAGCHGSVGVTGMPGIPSLVGQDPQYLITALGEYKDGVRKNATMKAMAAPLTSGLMNNLALFYALQKPARAGTPAPGNPAAGRTASAACAACHGAAGVSGNPSTPSLAGQDAQYLAGALHGYKDGARSNSTMKALAAKLGDIEIKNLAAFYAGLQPQRPNVHQPLTATEWAERCNRCHGVNGNSVDPLIPALASQHAAYLERALHAYRAGARRSTVMSAMADGLSENDIRNLAAYYASQKAHTVIYVPVPPR